MLSRRTVMVGMGALTVTTMHAVAEAPQATGSSFAELFTSALKAPDVLEKTRQEREGLAIEFDIYATRSIARRYKPSERKISDDAIEMIIAFEVGNRARYEQRYLQPVWPRGRSGVTIGIGYDVGYVTEAWLREDWGDILSDSQLALLARACKVTGAPAANLIPNVSTIRIGWDDAYKQFTRTSLPRFIAETLGVLPNATEMSADCLGALVSLVYNRGPSFKLPGDRHREMRAIHLHMVDKKYDRIPTEFRSMARLWERDPDVAGLVIRRNLEAALFEKGLE